MMRVIMRVVMMAYAILAATVSQSRSTAFVYGAMFGVLGFMLIDRWLTDRLIEKERATYAKQLEAIMGEMRETFTLQHEVIEATRGERDHYRRLYLKKVNGG